MHQLEYIVFLLNEYGLSDCNPVHLLADPKALLGDPSIKYPIVPDLYSAYLKLISELIYLSVNTCPDIFYIINALAQHNAIITTWLGVDVHFHFIHLHVNNGSSVLIWIPSHRNIADVLMKVLS